MRIAKAIAIVAVVLMVAGVVLGTGCGGRGPAAPVGQWHNAIVHFTGTETQTTSTFNITGNVFRFTWGARPTSLAISSGLGGLFACLVYTSGDGLIGQVSELKLMLSIETGIEYIYSGPGQFYFKVVAAGLNSWDIFVDSYY
jgi:hypothetical protein